MPASTAWRAEAEEELHPESSPDGSPGPPPKKQCKAPKDSTGAAPGLQQHQVPTEAYRNQHASQVPAGDKLQDQSLELYAEDACAQYNREFLV